jgi:hypothetical protein
MSIACQDVTEAKTIKARNNCSNNKNDFLIHLERSFY